MASDKNSPSPGENAAWAGCWEDVLCLAGSDLADEGLFVEAQQIVRRCRVATGDHGIDWFRRELENGLAFVAEQIAADPEDVDWQRIRALLMGAEAGLASSSDC